MKSSNASPAAGNWQCSCGASNLSRHSFCTQCGTARSVSSSQSSAPASGGSGWVCECGSSQPEASRFCTACGAPRKAPAAKPEPIIPKAELDMPTATPPAGAASETELIRKVVGKMKPDIANFAFFNNPSSAEEILLPLMNVLKENGNPINETAAEVCRDLYLNVWLAKQNGQKADSVTNSVAQQYFFIPRSAISKMVSICDAYMFTKGLL